jgi:hypothetical protein
MRGEAKDGSRRAAHRDAAPDGSRAARDPGESAVDRNAEPSFDVRAEEVEPHACAWGKAVHLAAEPWAADRERERREREPGAHVHELPEETAAQGGLVVDPEPSAGRAEERDRVACDEEPALAVNAEARARADGEPARSDAGDEHAEARSTRELDLRIGAGPGAPAEQKRDPKAQESSPLGAACPVPLLSDPPPHEPDATQRGAASVRSVVPGDRFRAAVRRARQTHALTPEQRVAFTRVATGPDGRMLR